MDDDDDENPEDEEPDDEEETEEEDPYTQVASSEFGADDKAKKESSKSESSSSALTRKDGSDGPLATSMDWGGALGKLRKRFEDVETGKAGKPSQALFRLMSAESPNQSIGSFISKADPQVVRAMSGAVGSLLGGLSSPQSGVEILVKSTADRIGALCFQLQMTGYMFRNAEYVMALKKLMKLRGTATLQDYKDAFERLDANGSGYIEAKEIAELLDDVYEGKTPAYEITSFIQFFDQNNDGKVSWDEFEQGLGAALASQSVTKSKLRNLLPQSGDGGDDEEDDDDDDAAVPDFGEPQVSGKIKIEMEGGKVVEVDAAEYIQNLKEEARALKDAIAQRKGGGFQQQSSGANTPPGFLAQSQQQQALGDEFGNITEYIASRQGDVKSLTEGISPEVVETMKMLVDFVLEGGDSGKGKDVPKEEMEMEIPGSALQQLALWQLVLGYKLREAEAKGEYLKLLE